MNNVYSFQPKLTVNEPFIREFVSAESPCFALGLVEERQQQCGFLALRPDEAIPHETADLGFRFGHSLLGDSDFEVIHFAFEFHDFKAYNVLINPNNPLVQTVLTTMMESEEYFFFAINPNQSVTAFRTEIGQSNLAGLKTHFQRIKHSTTTDRQYERTIASFTRNPQPAGSMLNWVCRDNREYLDLIQHRLELSPT